MAVIFFSYFDKDGLYRVPTSKTKQIHNSILAICDNDNKLIEANMPSEAGEAAIPRHWSEEDYGMDQDHSNF